MTWRWEDDPLLARCTVQWLGPAARQPEYWRAWFASKRSGLISAARRVLVSQAPRALALAVTDLHVSGVGEVVPDRLGLEGPHECYPDWLSLAESLEARGASLAALYCRFNDWVSLDFCPHVAGSGGWRDAWSRWEGSGFCGRIAVSEPAALVPVEATRIGEIARLVTRRGDPSGADAMLAGWIDGPGGGLCANLARLRHLRAAALTT